MALALAALQAIPELTGTQKTGFAFTVYTGDLVSHDPDNQLSRHVKQSFWMPTACSQSSLQGIY